MPFTPEDAAKHTKQADTPELKKKWADTANSVREECIAGGDDPKECDMTAIRIANDELSEADSGSPGDYLVVEDPDKPSTWHLPVKKDGKPDHRLMGAAWAALHKGYRGNKYEGPNKAEAIKKLKALYKSEDMPLPVEESAALQELWNDPAVLEMEVPLYAQSFDDFDAMAQARELEDQIKSQVYIFERLVENIFFFSGESPEVKRTAVRELVGQLEERMFPSLGDEEDEEPEDEEPEESMEENFAESFAEVDILNEGAIAHEDDGGPLTLRVVPIQPGWGNQRDNHYYSPEVLKRDAQRFVGAKMYETDHRDNEKSTRTWVSTVRAIQGFSDDGSPVAEVIVHDPVFARKVVNLNKAELLDKLECSISGEGRVRAGKIGERDGKIVDEILNIHSVDWVTKAGAGGHADAIMENEETDMTDEVVFLTGEKVTEVLDGLNIPRQEIRERLEEGEYETEDEIKEALEKEVEYVKKLTESGKPKNLGEADEDVEPKKSQADIIAEAEEKKQNLALEWFKVSKKE